MFIIFCMVILFVHINTEGNKRARCSFSLYLCVFTGQTSILFTLLIFVGFEHRQQGGGEVTAGLILDDVLQTDVVFWKTFQHKDKHILQECDERWGCVGSGCSRLVSTIDWCWASAPTFLKDPLNFHNLLVCSRRKNFYQDIFICAQTLRESKEANLHMLKKMNQTPYARVCVCVLVYCIYIYIGEQLFCLKGWIWF